MSYAKVLSVGLVGVRGHLVEVEADLANGLPMVALSGLPDTALNEARDRVRAAIVNSGESWPNRRITVKFYVRRYQDGGPLVPAGRARRWRGRPDAKWSERCRAGGSRRAGPAGRGPQHPLAALPMI